MLDLNHKIPLFWTFIWEKNVNIKKEVLHQYGLKLDRGFLVSETTVGMLY